MLNVPVIYASKLNWNYIHYKLRRKRGTPAVLKWWTCLDRIMDEAVRIRKFESDAQSEPGKISLNGKAEYFKPEYYTSSYRKGPSSED